LDRVKAGAGVILAGAAALALSTGLASAGSSAPAKKRAPRWIVSGTVTYAKRACFRAGGAGPAALAGAQVVVTPAKGRPGVGVLDAAGHFRVRVRGTGPLMGYVELEGRYLSVRPDLRGSVPYKLDMGRLVAGRSFRTNRVYFDSLGDAGAASIWTILNFGARAARGISSKKLNPIRVLWRYKADLRTWIRDQDGSAYIYQRRLDDPTITVGGFASGAKRDEYESSVLLHEYGHHVLDSVADPGPESTDPKHSFTSIHRDRPAVAWSEGFAHAFAAIVRADSRIMLGCQQVADLGVAPATPAPKDPRFAQYNEVAVGGAVWQLAKYFGGLKPIVQALATYRRDGHPPRDFRDARDSLIAGGLEKTGPQFFDVDQILRQRGIAWDISVALEDFKSVIPPWTDASVDSPYGTCETSYGNGGASVRGDLPFDIGADNCFIHVGVGVTVTFFFPYLNDGRHRSREFVVRATNNCHDGDGYPCSPATTYDVIVRRHIDKPLEFKTTLTLAVGASAEVVRFDALGGCTLVLTGEDCGV
jgi:hypothetical protein